MATEYLAVGTSELAGADFTLTDGAGSNVALKPANNTLVAIPSDAVADVQKKTSDAGYINVARLTATNPAVSVVGPGVFRAVRHLSVGVVGLDRD